MFPRVTGLALALVASVTPVTAQSPSSDAKVIDAPNEKQDFQVFQAGRDNIEALEERVFDLLSQQGLLVVDGDPVVQADRAKVLDDLYSEIAGDAPSLDPNLNVVLLVQPDQLLPTSALLTALEIAEVLAGAGP